MNSAADRLRALILDGGPISFARFMEEALYGENGYYSKEKVPIGPSGDYITGSSASRFFAESTARLVRSLDEVLGVRSDYLEAGYGGGEHVSRLAEALAGGIEGHGRGIYAWDRVPRLLPGGIRVLDSPDALGPRAFEGLLFSYELFDALPVHRLVRRAGELRELLVGAGDEGFEWCEAELSEPGVEAWNVPGLEGGQVLDVTPGWSRLYGALASVVGRGLMVTCDYGFSREKLLDPRVRMNGTLACYRGHRVHRDPFVDVGRQDLTAHVDFTSLIEAGESAGLETVGLFRQAEWLASLGILEEMNSRTPKERVEIMGLMDLEGMGEEIRILVQARGVDHQELPLPLSYGP